MKSFYLGCDVSKGYSDFIILNSGKQCVMKSFQLDDTFEGHCSLYDILSGFLENNPDSVLYSAVESTGGYENNWYNALVKFKRTINIETARLNPLVVNHNSKADMKRNTTDKISAQNIAEYLIAHPEKVSCHQEDPFANLRKQRGFIKMLTKQSSQLLNQLESLVYEANPEILAYCKNAMPEWVLKLLLKYPAASNLAGAGTSSLAQIPYVTSRRARELVSNAKKSVASATDPITQKLIVATAKQIVHLKKTIGKQMKIIAEECSMPEADLLKTFPGIGDRSAFGLILEIQSIERFRTAKQLSSYFGLHPVYKTSGDGAGGFRMSKQGRKEPRHILFMVALNAVQKNPLISEVYEDHIKRGKNKMSAVGICMHKILRIIYGMLKHKQTFDPEIDRRNRERKSRNRVKHQRNDTRRYQDYNSQAPISGRQARKRLKQKQSRSDNVAKIGIGAPVSANETIA